MIVVTTIQYTVYSMQHTVYVVIRDDVTIVIVNSGSVSAVRPGSGSINTKLLHRLYPDSHKMIRIQLQGCSGRLSALVGKFWRISLYVTDDAILQSSI